MARHTRGAMSVTEHIDECLLRNDFDTLGQMLAKLGLDYAETSRETVLHRATRRHNDKAVDFLLGLGADINARNSSGFTPVAIAVENASEEMLEFLLSKKADPNISDWKGLTPLMKAAEAGEAGLIAALVTHGADLNTKDPDGRTALMLAAQKGQAMIVGALAGHGASLTATDNEGNTVMHYAVGCQDNGVMLQFLAEKSRLLNLGNNAGETPVIIAVKRHQPENLQTLMDLGADAAIADKSGKDAVAHGRALKRAKFRTAMKEVMESEGETARRDMRRGSAEKITIRKPLKLKKTASFMS